MYEVTFVNLVGYVIIGIIIGGLITCAVYELAGWVDRRRQ